MAGASVPATGDGQGLVYLDSMTPVVVETAKAWARLVERFHAGLGLPASVLDPDCFDASPWVGAAPLQSRLVGDAESYTGCKSCGRIMSSGMTNRNTDRNTPPNDHKSNATHAMTAGANHTAGGCDDTDFSRSEPRP